MSARRGRSSVASRRRLARLYRSGDVERAVSEGAASEHSGSYRTPFRRDYARLVHSAALRRLQGKTQLFPGIESDFFRNRLTHSLEVAQVAKSIALRLNQESPELKRNPLDVDLVEFAGLAHDLGHPPFGHNGERALDDRMKGFGGFEGNAQTLRIVARLEKKRLGLDVPPAATEVGIDQQGVDYRAGLNLTARSLAAVLKYDREIPIVRAESDRLVKGYYRADSAIVDFARRSVLGEVECSSFKTIECQIMDLADDIAYSTYDLEDTFKAGFLTPMDLLSLSDEFRGIVAGQVGAAIGASFTARDVRLEVVRVFQDWLHDEGTSKKEPLTYAVTAHQRSKDVAQIGYYRTDLTADLVGQAVSAVEFTYNTKCPALSSVRLAADALRRVETLKRITYNAVILSPRLKVAEHRGYEIVTTIFEALESAPDLLPDDFRQQYRRLQGEEAKKRVICDFVAGMTDAYAIEFYARLRSESAQTIFKPL